MKLFSIVWMKFDNVKSIIKRYYMEEYKESERDVYATEGRKKRRGKIS